MICTFFGHADAPSEVALALKHVILDLIDKKEVKNFYVGNNGSFDFFVQKTLKEISGERANINYTIVLSRMNERPLNGEQEKTVFPEKMETAPARFSIFKRNEWLIANSQIVVVYMTNQISNCYKWVSRAKRKGLYVINLSDAFQK